MPQMMMYEMMWCLHSDKKNKLKKKRIKKKKILEKQIDRHIFFLLFFF